MPLNRIVIVGGGCAGWLAAAALVRSIERGKGSVTVVDLGGEDDSLGVALPAETLLPASLEWIATLGLSAQLLINAHGSFTLGNALSDWGGVGTVFQASGDVGAPLGSVAFHQLARRACGDGAPPNFANYALAALCAQSQRFAPPEPTDRSVMSSLAYGISVNTAALRDGLRQDAMSRGVEPLEGLTLTVALGDDQLIDHVTLDGATVEGDFFIDCTGAQGRLISLFSTESFTGWEHPTPVLQYGTSLRPAHEMPQLYAHTATHPAGWQRFTPLNGAVAETYVTDIEDKSTTSAALRPLITGRRLAPWQGNCVALGGSAQVIDPVAQCQLHLMLAAVGRLVGLLPTDRACLAEANEYNRQTAEEQIRAHDVALAHYVLNQRHGERFWDAARALAVPKQLAHKIALYAACGRIAQYDEELYSEQDWITAFDALGLRANGYDAQANAFSVAAVEAHFAKIRNVMLSAVAALPRYGDFLGGLGR